RANSVTGRSPARSNTRISRRRGSAIALKTSEVVAARAMAGTIHAYIDMCQRHALPRCAWHTFVRAGRVRGADSKSVGRERVAGSDGEDGLGCPLRNRDGLVRFEVTHVAEDGERLAADHEAQRGLETLPLCGGHALAHGFEDGGDPLAAAPFSDGLLVACAGTFRSQPRVEVVTLGGAKQRFVFRDRAREDVDERDEALFRRALSGRSRQQLTNAVDADRDRQLEQQRLLRGEVPVGRGARDQRLLRSLCHRRVVTALDDRTGGGDDRGAGPALLVDATRGLERGVLTSSGHAVMVHEYRNRIQVPCVTDTSGGSDAG